MIGKTAGHAQVPSAGFVFLVSGIAALGAIQHWWFRVGRPMPRSWLTAADTFRGVTARCAFAALPACLAFGSVAVAFGFVRFVPVLPLPVARTLIFAGGACAVAFGFWAYKEFTRPSLSRTPAWLRELMEKDTTLMADIFGDRIPDWR